MMAIPTRKVSTMCLGPDGSEVEDQPEDALLDPHKHPLRGFAWIHL